MSDTSENIETKTAKKPSRIFTPDETAKIKEMFLTGVPIEKIALTIHVNKPRIKEWLRDNNITRRPLREIQPTAEQRAEVERLYREGIGGRKIAEAIGHSQETITKWMKEWGLDKAGRWERAKAEDKEKIRQLFEQGVSLRDMVEIVGRSAPTVSRWVNEMGLSFQVRQQRQRVSEALECEQQRRARVKARAEVKPKSSPVPRSKSANRHRPPQPMRELPSIADRFRRSEPQSVSGGFTITYLNEPEKSRLSFHEIMALDIKDE
jgi:transposase-like protein